MLINEPFDCQLFTPPPKPFPPLPSMFAVLLFIEEFSIRTFVQLDKYNPPPSVSAVFETISKLINLEFELSRYIPPPKCAVFPIILNLDSVGEAFSQYMPPPLISGLETLLLLPLYTVNPFSTAVESSAVVKVAILAV